MFIMVVLYFFCLPSQLFQDPYSTVLESRDGQLLSASIARDGQWRFPEIQKVPDKFATAIITYEDKRFRYHPGVDLLSLARAMRQNVRQGHIVSGGSTLSMQVIRLSRKGRSRSVFEKLVEVVLATRLTLRYSKDEVLALYAAHAPFGGNVVGLEAACWRYFGRDAASLSWGEAALLAVLPNSPALIHPGRNRQQLLDKRNALLDKLAGNGVMDAFTCELAKAEPIPNEPLPLPRYARHMLTRMSLDGRAQTRLRSSLDLALQMRTEQLLQDHHRRLSANQIHNMAVLIADVKTGEVLAYVGNVENRTAYHGDDVDVTAAPRSTGSILKPFLYAAMLDDGKILPKSLLPDIPTYINGFAPRNFSHDFDGAVPADKALIRSLNIPAVHLLREYRYERFHDLLKRLGMTTLTHPPDHYGLALILGGAEGTLWDITGMYASMARTLNQYSERPGHNRYDRSDIHGLRYEPADTTQEEALPVLEETSELSAGAIFQTFEALKELYRPGEESGWRYFNSAKTIAWKTGTSFGFRDAWAIGVTPDYVVGVWAGNADGEGRPGLTGTDAAAPVLFDLFSQLHGQRWFSRPPMEMEKVTVCAQSGFRSTSACSETISQWVIHRGLESKACPYHHKIHLSPDRRYRVHSDCEAVADMVEVPWFVLPPVQEYYYRGKNLTYRPLPPFRGDCQVTSAGAPMELIYPKANARIFVPRDLDGSVGSTIFHLAHRNPKATVYWHLDGTFMGSTRGNHQLALAPPEGWHKLTLVDDNGASLEYAFQILSKM